MTIHVVVILHTICVAWQCVRIFVWFVGSDIVALNLTDKTEHSQRSGIHLTLENEIRLTRGTRSAAKKQMTNLSIERQARSHLTISYCSGVGIVKDSTSMAMLRRDHLWEKDILS